MNKKQLTAMWIGIAFIVGMLLFPPWTTRWETRLGSGESSQYAFLLSPPRSGTGQSYPGSIMKETRQVALDFPRLAIQCLVVAMLTAGAILTRKTA